jgi:hypothetical protein
MEISLFGKRLATGCYLVLAISFTIAAFNTDSGDFYDRIVLPGYCTFVFYQFRLC